MSFILFILLIGFVVGSSIAVWFVALDFISDLPIPLYLFLPLYFFLAFMSLALIVSFWIAVFQAFGV